MGVAIVLAATSCYDDVRQDYEYTGMYFSLQQPLRTVIAEADGVYEGGAIKVGVAIGGKLEVDTNDWATFEIDESLITDPAVKLMPSNYYTLSNPNTMTVSKSNNQIADVTVSFTDDFYADVASTTSTSQYYAIPFRLVDHSCDITLTGQDYTIVAVQYESLYSGTYYNQGVVAALDNGVPTFTKSYYNDDLNDGRTETFYTTAYRTVVRPSQVVTVNGSDVNTGDVAITIFEPGDVMSDGSTATELSIEVTAADTNDDFYTNSGRGTITYDEETKECVIEIYYQTNSDGNGLYAVEETLTRREDLFEEISRSVKYWYATE